jgi:hypothetical protein
LQINELQRFSQLRAELLDLGEERAHAYLPCGLLRTDAPELLQSLLVLPAVLFTLGGEGVTLGDHAPELLLELLLVLTPSQSAGHANVVRTPRARTRANRAWSDMVR